MTQCFKMKIEFLLFLDFDGVLHGCNDPKLFNCLERFENIIRDYPDVKIVFSTSWRFEQKFEHLIGYFSEDLHDRFVGINPTVQERWPPYVKYERYKECMRFMEIQSYEGPWLAIDDAADLFIPNCPNLIVCDTNIGIDEKVERQIREYFDSKGARRKMSEFDPTQHIACKSYIDEIKDELDFLRFFYDSIKNMMSDAGTDEVYIVTESYIETRGKEPPDGYR